MLARMEEWSMDNDGTTGDAKVDSNAGWCPGKTIPEVRLLGTYPFWSSLGQPLGRPPTDLYLKTPPGCQCSPGGCMTSMLPSFPHLLQTSAQTASSRGRLTVSKLAQLFPWPFIPVPTSLEHLIIYSVSPGSVVLSKVSSAASVG